VTPVTFRSNKGNDGPSAVEPQAQARLCRDPRGRHGGIRAGLVLRRSGAPKLWRRK